jgi:hypothetical protein
MQYARVADEHLGGLDESLGGIFAPGREPPYQQEAHKEIQIPADGLPINRQTSPEGGSIEKCPLAVG